MVYEYNDGGIYWVDTTSGLVDRGGLAMDNTGVRRKSRTFLGL